MFQMNGTIRYSEVDKECRLTWSSLLNYFQDCSVAHSESLNLGVDYLEEHHMAWLLTSWQVVVTEMPTLGEEIKVQTWPYDFKGLYGYRNFLLRGKEDQVFAYANSVWALMDTESKRPRKVTEDIVKAYGLEAPYPMEICPRKLAEGDCFEKMEPIRVQKYFIDTNGHMNNEKYVMLAEEFVPGYFQIGEIRVEYKKSAMYEDLIIPRVTVDEKEVTVGLYGLDDKPYAIVKFIKRG